MNQTDTVRVPPHSAEAEIGLLGCCILDCARGVGVLRQYKLGTEAFYNPVHQMIARTILDMMDGKKWADLFLLTSRLRDDGQLEACGGEAYLQRLVDQTPTVEHCEYYAVEVAEKWTARKIVQAGMKIVDEAYVATEPSKLLADAPNRFSEIATGKANEPKIGDVLDRSIQKWIDARKHKKPAIDLYMPWDHLTELMQGLEVGLTILAGRPSAGKTTLEGIIAGYQCERDIPVARATADSSFEQLAERQVCNVAGVSLAKLKFGFARDDQIDMLREARNEIVKYPQFINDTDTEIAAICAWARMMKAKHGIRLLTVDYMQQLRASHLGGRGATDPVIRVTAISSMLKALAFELKIPILALSQLSREVEKENREPRLSDLRDSGGIEQDASKVVFCYLDAKKKNLMDLADGDATKHKRPIWINVMKNKDGGLGALPFWMLPPYFKMTPAQSERNEADGKWVHFIDDRLSGDAREDDERWERDPDLIPTDEGTARRKTRAPTTDVLNMDEASDAEEEDAS